MKVFDQLSVALKMEKYHLLDGSDSSRLGQNEKMCMRHLNNEGHTVSVVFYGPDMGT